MGFLSSGIKVRTLIKSIYLIYLFYIPVLTEFKYISVMKGYFKLL